MENKSRIIRSLSFAPAYDSDAVMRAADAGVDAVGPCFEGLTPRQEKRRARDLFPDLARELTRRGVLVMPRVNKVGEGAEEDLDVVVSSDVHCVCLPRIESPEQIAQFDRLIAKAEANNSLPLGWTLTRPIVETAVGLFRAHDIAAASPRVTYMGGTGGGFYGDMGATLGSMYGPDGMASYYIRAKVILDVRAAGVEYPIGGGRTTRMDPDNVREFAWETRRLGYTGQYVSGVTPGQFSSAIKEVVQIIHEVYTPTANEVAEWQGVVPALEEAESTHDEFVMVDEKRYNTVVLPRLKALLELASRVGLTT